MNELEFIFEGQSIIIQCNSKDKMIDICNKFATKTQLNINNLYFLCNGNTINLELQFAQIKQDNNKTKILVNKLNEIQNLFLKFKLNDYNIIINFTKNFDIKVEYGESLNKRIYNGSFSLEELKNKSKFFKMFDSIQEAYNDIKLLLAQNSFYIQPYEKSITLCIKKQIGIQYDIVFPLKEGSADLKEIVYELYEKNIFLEKKIDILTKKNVNLEHQINNLNLKVDNLEKQIENIISNEKSSEDEDIKINAKYNKNDQLTSDEMRIKALFDEKMPKKFNLLYNGLDREKFFNKCNGKSNLLFLINDERGMKYGGYMPSKLMKNEKGKCLSIKDENSFIFNLDSFKKFKVINPEKAIEILNGYLICFGGKYNDKGNDFFIRDNKNACCTGHAGSSVTDSYGDQNYETTRGNGNFKINNIKIYQLLF